MLRSAVFDRLARMVSLHGEVLPRALLDQGFELGRDRVHVIGPQGIFKPLAMGALLSITTSPSGPYDDAFDPSGSAIQGLHGKRIALPRKRDERPTVHRLEERYERFLAAAAAS